MSDTPNTSAADETLGDAGRKALVDERAARKAAEQKAADLERRLGEIETQQLRSKIAANHNLTEAQAARLKGSTEDELNADAEELLAAFKPAEDETPDVRRTPRERLRPGAAPSAEPGPSMADVASKVLGS
jgi:hypothetical protein